MSDENIKWDPIPSVAPQKPSEDIQWDKTPKLEVSGTAADLEPYKPAGVFSTRGKPAAKVADITKVSWLGNVRNVLR